MNAGTQKPVRDESEGITGAQLAAARSRARLTQRELAALVRHSERAIQQWEEGRVTPSKVPLVRSVLGPYLLENDTNPLAQYSNLALLAEVARRLDAAGPNSDVGVAVAAV